MPRNHSPEVTETHTLTVQCHANGPRILWFDDYERQSNLADLEAFCSKLRDLGANDETRIANAVRLNVTLDVRKEGGG